MDAGDAVFIEDPTRVPVGRIDGIGYGIGRVAVAKVAGFHGFFADFLSERGNRS